jgi:hypothetical protein
LTTDHQEVHLKKAACPHFQPHTEVDSGMRERNKIIFTREREGKIWLRQKCSCIVCQQCIITRGMRHYYRLEESTS